jgi:hypothetical protein
LIACAKRSILNINRNLDVTCESFEVCVDEYSQLGYRLEMCVNNTAVFSTIDYGYNPDRLKSFATRQGHNSGMVFDSLLDDKAFSVTCLQVVGKIRRTVQVALSILKAFAGFIDDYNLVTISPTYRLYYKLTGKLLLDKLCFILERTQHVFIVAMPKQSVGSRYHVPLRNFYVRLKAIVVEKSLVLGQFSPGGGVQFFLNFRQYFSAYKSVD